MKDTNLKAGILWNAAGNLIYLISQWLITVLVATMGSFRDAGVLSIAMSVSATFQTLALFGMRNYQVSDIEERYSNTCYVGFRVVTCAAALVGCVAFALIAGYAGETLVAILLFMLFRLTENFSDVLHGIAQKNDRLDIAGKSFAVRGVCVLAIFVAVFGVSHSLVASLGAMAAFSFGAMMLYDVRAVLRVSAFGLSLKGSRWQALARETIPLCVYFFLYAAITTVPKLILERRCGEEILGAYSSIFAPALLVQAAVAYVYTPFAQIFAAHRASGDRTAFLRLFGRISAVIGGVSAVVLVAAQFLGAWGLQLVFGARILPYVGFLTPILIAITLTSFFGFLCMLAVVLRRFSWLLAACGVGFLLCAVLTAPFIKLLDVNGTSYSLCAAMLASSVLLMVGIAKDVIKKE